MLTTRVEADHQRGGRGRGAPRVARRVLLGQVARQPAQPQRGRDERRQRTHGHGSAMTTPTIDGGEAERRTASSPPSPYSEYSSAAAPAGERRRARRPPARTDDFSAPGVDSRSASTGSTFVARRAGTSAARTVTPTPTASETHSWRGVDLQRGERQGEPDRVHEPLQALGHADPEPERRPPRPAARGASASSSRLPSTWRRRAPIARSSAISRDRWVTIIVKVFQMMNEPTNRAIPAKRPKMTPTILKFVLVASAFSCGHRRPGDRLAAGGQRPRRAGRRAWPG